MNLSDDFKKYRDAERPESQSAVLVKAPPLSSIIGAYTSDVGVAHDYGGTPTQAVRDIRGPVAAVGLTGLLLPGSYALVVPASRRQALVEFLNDTAVLQQWALQGGSQITSTSPLRPEIIALYPGDVMPLGRLSTEGVSVYMAPGQYSGVYPVTADAPMVRPEAYIRVFPSDAHLPQRIGYRPISAWTRGQPSAAAPVAAETPQVLVGNASHVRVVFQDNVLSVTPIVGAETATYDVWWLDHSGIWSHHGDDDLDAAGRQAVTATHNAEVYSVHPGMLGLTLVRTAGDSLFYNATTFDAYGGYRR